MKFSVILKSSIKAAAILFRRIGLFKTIGVLVHIAASDANGEPWSFLPPAEDEKDIFSRKQSGQAVLLYRALLWSLDDEDRAFEITREVILAGAVIFMKSVIPLFEPSMLKKMDREQKRNLIMEMTDEFKNADMENVRINHESFHYTITRCRLLELMQALGHEELAPIFCESDDVFFDDHQPHLELERPSTLARDGKPCEFKLRLKVSEDNL